MHENSEGLFREYALRYFNESARVLEFGPDLSPSTLQVAAEGRYASWETIDLRTGPTVGSSLTHYMDDEEIVPLEDELFDIVVSSSVIEHVRRPWRWFPELARMCRKGGFVVTISPVSWPEHKNEAVPYDCWRIMPDGMRVLVEDAGLDLLFITHKTIESASANGRWYPGETYRFLAPPRRRSVELVVNIVDRVTRRPRSAAVDCLTIAQKTR